MDLKKTMNTDYIGSWDFIKNEKKVLTVKEVVQKMVFNPNKNRDENSVILYFSNHPCGMFLNTTNKKMLIKLFGTSETEKYVGKNIGLITKLIKVRGEDIEAVRIDSVLPTSTPSAPPKEKVVMDKDHKGWDAMLEAVKSGTYTANKLRESYTISDDVLLIIQGYEPKAV